MPSMGSVTGYARATSPTRRSEVDDLRPDSRPSHPWPTANSATRRRRGVQATREVRWRWGGHRALFVRPQMDSPHRPSLAVGSKTLGIYHTDTAGTVCRTPSEPDAHFSFPHVQSSFCQSFVPHPSCTSLLPHSSAVIGNACAVAWRVTTGDQRLGTGRQTFRRGRPSLAPSFGVECSLHTPDGQDNLWADA
jgi:hypothetical protein